MASGTVASDGSKSLDFLQTVVQQREEIFGPLIALDSNGSRCCTVSMHCGHWLSLRAQR